MSEAPSLTLSTGILLVLSAPSGTGKTTLARRLVREMPGAVFSVSYTTRRPRGAEVDGVDYRFVDDATFREMIGRGAFVEWAQVHGHFYGSPMNVVDDVLRTGGLAVFDIDVQGGNAIKDKHPNAVLVFVLPPSMAELERRLRERKTDSEQTTRGRLLAARAEVARGTACYDYVIVNDDLESAFGKLRSVVVAERCRRSRANWAVLTLGDQVT